MGCLQTQHSCPRNPWGIWGQEWEGGLTWEPEGVCSPGRAMRTARALSVKVRGVRAARTQGRRVNSGAIRVCAPAGRRPGAGRCAVRGAAGPGKGARRALCPAFACKCGAPGAGRGKGELRAVAGRVAPPRAEVDPGRTHPGSAEGPRIRIGLRLGLAAPGGPPAARTHRRQAPLLAAMPALQCRPAPASEQRGAGRGLHRAGRRREQRRSPGTLPGARRALPRARPPAPSLI